MRFWRSLFICLLMVAFLSYVEKSYAAIDYVRSFTHGSQPSGVTIFDDILYVTDNVDSNLYTFDLSGTFLDSYSGYMSPMGIAALGGKLYTSNTDTEGVLSTVPGNPPVSFATGLDSPWGVTAHSDHLFVVSTTGDYITEYDQAGTVLTTFGDSVLIDPASIAFDSTGRAYVTNFNTGEITRFSSDFGSNATWVTGLGNPFGIAIDEYDNVYISDNTDNVVRKYDIDGNLIATFGSAGSGPGQFNAPLGLFVDNEGNIYVADSGNGRVEQFFDTDFPQPTPTPIPGGGGISVSTGSPSAPSCSDTAPNGIPDLFQIDVTNTTATLYFVPVLGAGNYVIAYGNGNNTNQYGIGFDHADSSGVVAYTINDLAPKSAYSFTVRSGNGCATGGWGNTIQVATANSSTTGKSFYKSFTLKLGSFL